MASLDEIKKIAEARTRDTWQPFDLRNAKNDIAFIDMCDQVFDNLIKVAEAAKVIIHNKSCDSQDGSCITQHYVNEECDCGLVKLEIALKELESE